MDCAFYRFCSCSYACAEDKALSDKKNLANAHKDSAMAALIAHGCMATIGATSGIAYVLLHEGEILVFNENKAQFPFSKKPEKILIRAKIEGKIFSVED